jgi:hypothetical protein
MKTMLRAKITKRMGPLIGFSLKARIGAGYEGKVGKTLRAARLCDVGITSGRSLEKDNSRSLKGLKPPREYSLLGGRLQVEWDGSGT